MAERRSKRAAPPSVIITNNTSKLCWTGVARPAWAGGSTGTADEWDGSPTETGDCAGGGGGDCSPGGGLGDPGTDGGNICLGPQSAQSVPYAQRSLMAPAPPSWHAPVWAYPGHVLLHSIGGDGGGVGGGDGRGDGGGGDGGDGGGGGMVRGPLSKQSVPKVHCS